MGKIEQIQEAIINAYENDSKLTQDILDLPSFSSNKIKHLLNNLGAISSRFLEIGLHKSGTFISTLYDNKCLGLGVDNWSQLEQGGLSKQMAYDNCESYLAKIQYTICEKDCFKMEANDFPMYEFDLYSYDGNHSFESQYKGVEYFLPYMANQFILTIDDTNWEAPRLATIQAIHDLKLKILYTKHLTDGKDNGEWHNGFDVFFLKKTT